MPRLLPGGTPRPSALRGYRLGGWRWLAPGVRRIRILSALHPGGSLDLLRISPGQSLPVHGHNGLEITCVLAGGFTDRIGEFGPGDVAETDSVEEHQPVADRDAECVCLVSSNGPLRMRGLLPRLLQPLIGV
jgi:putative transcriptional regulator